MREKLGMGWKQPVTDKIQNSLYLIWHDYIGGRSFRLSLVFFFFLLLLFAVSFWRIPPQIPLAYSRPWGVAQLVPSTFLVVLIFLALVLVMANGILASLLFSTEQLLARILLVISSLSLLLFDITLLRVILLII